MTNQNKIVDNKKKCYKLSLKGPENILFCDFCLCCFVGMSLWKLLIWAPIRNLKQFYLSAFMNLKKLFFYLHLVLHRSKEKNPHIRSWKFVFASHMHLLNAPFKKRKEAQLEPQNATRHLHLKAYTRVNLTLDLPLSAENINSIWALNKKMTASANLCFSHLSHQTASMSRKQSWFDEILAKWNILWNGTLYFYLEEHNNATSISNYQYGKRSDITYVQTHMFSFWQVATVSMYM